MYYKLPNANQPVQNILPAESQVLLTNKMWVGPFDPIRQFTRFLKIRNSITNFGFACVEQLCD